MTNDEVNRYIHEQIMGKCWHDWRSMGPDWGYRCGKDCGATSSYSGNPNYCSDASPRSLLNDVVAKVVEQMGCGEFYGYLVYQVEPNPEGDLFVKYRIPTATAEQIARACVEAHKSK